MIDILLCGCLGAMGKVVRDTAASERFCDKLRIAAGVDMKPSDANDFPVYRSIENASGHFDAIVDFSNPALTSDILGYACKNGIPVVLATTGHSAEQKKQITDASKIIPVFYTANMSIGVNLLSELVKQAASVLGADFDVEIVEKHHNRKLDAPSGTAVMLSESVKEGENRLMTEVYDRHSERRKRAENEIGIHSIRGGTIVGEHDVIFAGEDEVITLSHSAGSRRIFASGALNAALFVEDKSAGIYTMKELLAKKGI